MKNLLIGFGVVGGVAIIGTICGLAKRHSKRKDRELKAKIALDKEKLKLENSSNENKD